MLVIVIAVLGFLLHQANELDGALRLVYPPPNFSADKIPNLKGQVALITGANVGLGKETAIQLAKKGATVVLACRTLCENVAEDINKMGGDALAMKLDLSDSVSIYDFASSYRKLGLPIHMLILNAGVMMIQDFTTTKDGFESQIGINWLGHFYLQHLLQDIVEKSAPSRVIILSSKGYLFAPKNLYETVSIHDDAQSRAVYGPATNYGISKLFNIYHAQELDAQMRAQNKQVYIIAVHPGSIPTDLGRHIAEVVIKTLGVRAANMLQGLFEAILLDVHHGALTQLWAATSPEIVQKNLSGSYAVPIGRVALPSELARDVEFRKRAWTFGEEIIQKFPRNCTQLFPVRLKKELCFGKGEVFGPS